MAQSQAEQQAQAQIAGEPTRTKERQPQPATGTAADPTAQAQVSPWWQVPESLLKHMAQQSPQVLVDNLLQWLQEQRPDLYTAFTPATLQHKVAYFVRRPQVSHGALADYLASQLS